MVVDSTLARARRKDNMAVVDISLICTTSLASCGVSFARWWASLCQWGATNSWGTATGVSSLDNLLWYVEKGCLGARVVTLQWQGLLLLPDASQ
jgi:hypothetical protein